jgi:hypothetical protein
MLQWFHAFTSFGALQHTKKAPPGIRGGLWVQLVCSVVLVAETATAVTTTIIATVSAAIAATVSASTVSTAIAATVSAAAASAVSTAVTTTATISTAATSATAEAGAIAFGTRTSLVHDQVAAVKAFTVGAFDGSTAGIVIGHFNESEATATVRHLVHDDLGRSDLSERSEKLVEILVLY